MHGNASRGTADLPADRIDHRRTLDDLATRRVVDLSTSTMSTRQAAEHLDVDRTTVTRRIVRGSLFGVRVDDRYRLPLWQFVAPGGTLPGLATIIGAIPDRYPLTMLDEYLRAPREEFDGRSILAHLADGGAPEDAARLLDQLDRW